MGPFLLLHLLATILSSTTATEVDKNWKLKYADNVTTVHLVSSCHLDVGFADTAANIVNRYFVIFFPEAVATAEQLRRSGRPERLVFTTHTYLVYLYLNCPRGMGIACPNATAVDSFKKAVAMGDIVWHAFPFNGEAEIMDASLFEFGISLTHALDDQFSKPHTITMSQRDVPGTTRAIIPLLNRMGVKALTVGTNRASMPPAVPQAFAWMDPKSGADIVAMWHPGGYGGPPTSLDNFVVVPGMSHVLAFAIRGDNSGPPSADEVITNYQSIKKLFPNAKVVASDYDAFVTELLKFKSQLKSYVEEIGDTWIYGTASDPGKVSQFREIMAARTECLQAGECSLSDQRFFNFSALLLKNAEHTWGKDIKTFLHDTKAWTNKAFQEAIKTEANFKDVINSWIEQRNWGITYPIQALGDHPLKAKINQRLEALKFNGHISLDGFSVAKQPFVFDLKDFEVTFSPETGAFSKLVDKTGGTPIEWTSANGQLGSLVYKTFTLVDYEKFWAQYFYTKTSYGPLDFGKPGLNDTVSSTIVAKLNKLYVSRNQTSFLANLSFNQTYVTDYGAPAQAWIRTDYEPNKKTFFFTVYLVNKTTTRRPESLHFQFEPTLVNMSVNKLGSKINVLDVMLNGSRHLHGQYRGGIAVMNPLSTQTMNITSLDSTVVCIGPPNPFPTPESEPDIKSGFSFNIYNNIWGTNYIMWYPFLPSEASTKYRFKMTFY